MSKIFGNNMNLNLTVVYSNLMVSISNDIMCFEGGVVEVNCSGPMKGKMTMETLSALAWLREFSTSVFYWNSSFNSRYPTLDAHACIKINTSIYL